MGKLQADFGELAKFADFGQSGQSSKYRLTSGKVRADFGQILGKVTSGKVQADKLWAKFGLISG